MPTSWAPTRASIRAVYMLRKAIRWNPGNAGNYYNLAHIRWSQRRFDEATELYHFAFCLEDKDENLARAYFAAARSQGRAEEALATLRKRFERFGAKSWHPARTLYGALAQLERLPEAFAVLDQAMTLRPDDGDLTLYVAETCTLNGAFVRGEELLQQAKGRSQPTVWLRTAANLASAQGENVKARDLWAEVLKVEPLAEDAHRAYARLLADTVDRPAALRHLQEACRRFTHNFALNKLYMEWLRDDGPAAVEPVLRRLVEIHPTDAWTRRELSWQLLELGQLGEAEKELEIAAHLEPDAVALHGLRGQVLLRQNKPAEAKEAYRQAVRTSVDYEYAIHELVAACASHVERREALHFVHQELIRQVTFGDGLLAFRDTAARALEPEELLAILREALEARRDLWHAWAALVRQLSDMDQLEEAHTLARQAVERFPLLPALWIDLGHVCRRRDDAAGEIAALTQALQLNPRLECRAARAGRRLRARRAARSGGGIAPARSRGRRWSAAITWTSPNCSGARGTASRHSSASGTRSSWRPARIRPGIGCANGRRSWSARSWPSTPPGNSASSGPPRPAPGSGSPRPTRGCHAIPRRKRSRSASTNASRRSIGPSCSTRATWTSTTRRRRRCAGAALGRGVRRVPAGAVGRAAAADAARPGGLAGGAAVPL